MTGHTTATGLPDLAPGTDLPDAATIDAATIDVETRRGRRAVHRWERTSVGDVFERLTWSRPDQPALVAADGAELWPRVEPVFTATGLTVGATIAVGGAPVAGSPAFADLLEGRADTEPDVEIHGDDIWQLLFTSGTTAMPKGVMLSHSYAHLAALNFSVSLSRGLRHDRDLRLTTFLPMIYHVGGEIFPFAAFLAGGSLTLGRRPAPGPVAAATVGATAIWAGSPQFVAMLADELDDRPELDVSSLTTTGAPARPSTAPR